MRRIAVLTVMLPLVGCGGIAPPYAVLPRDAVVGAGDPARSAITSTAYVFSAPASVAGQPDAAARATAQVEYLATEIPGGPRFVEYSPLVGRELLAARDELRAALGIARDAPPQAVVDALYAASRALRAGDAAAASAALPAAVFADGRATLTRLADLPALPRTRLATALTSQEMSRVDQTSRMSGGEDGGRQ